MRYLVWGSVRQVVPETKGKLLTESYTWNILRFLQARTTHRTKNFTVEPVSPESKGRLEESGEQRRSIARQRTPTSILPPRSSHFQTSTPHPFPDATNQPAFVSVLLPRACR